MPRGRTTRGRYRKGSTTAGQIKAYAEGNPDKWYEVMQRNERFRRRCRLCMEHKRTCAVCAGVI